MIRDRSGDAISVPYLLLFVIGLPYTAQTAIPLGTTHPSALLIYVLNITVSRVKVRHLTGIEA